MSRCQLVHDLRKCPVVVGSPQTQTQRDQVTRIIHRLIVQRGHDHNSLDDLSDQLQDGGNDAAVSSQKKQSAVAGHNRLVLSRRATKQAVTSSVPSNNEQSDHVTNTTTSDYNDSNRPSGEAKTGYPVLSDDLCCPSPTSEGGLVTVFSCTAADNGSSTTTESSSDEFSEMLPGGGDTFAEGMDVVVADGEDDGHGSRNHFSSPIRTGSHGNMVVTCEGLSDVIDRSPNVLGDAAEERMNVVIELMPQPQMMLPYELLLPVTSTSTAAASSAAPMSSAMDDTADETSSSMMVHLHPSQQQQQQQLGTIMILTESSSTREDPLLLSTQTEIGTAMELQQQQQPPVDVLASSPATGSDCGVRMDDDESYEHGNKYEDDVRQPEVVATASSSSCPRVVMPAAAAAERLEGLKDFVASSSGSVNSTNSVNSSHSNNGSNSSGGGGDSRANKAKLRRLVTTDATARNVAAANTNTTSRETASYPHQQQQQQQHDQPPARDVAPGGSSSSSSSSSSLLLRPVPPASHAGTGSGSSSSSSSAPNRTDKINLTPSVMSPSSPTASRGSNSSGSGVVNATGVVPTPPSGHRSTHTSLRNFGKKQLGHGNAGAPKASTEAAVPSSASLTGQPPDETVDDDCNASSLVLQLDDSATEK